MTDSSGFYGAQEVRLRFTPAEASFYGTIRDDGRKARNTLQELLLEGGHSEYAERAARGKAEVCVLLVSNSLNWPLQMLPLPGGVANLCQS